MLNLKLEYKPTFWYLHDVIDRRLITSSTMSSSLHHRPPVVQIYEYAIRQTRVRIRWMDVSLRNFPLPLLPFRFRRLFVETACGKERMTTTRRIPIRARFLPTSNPVLLLAIGLFFSSFPRRSDRFGVAAGALGVRSWPRSGSWRSSRTSRRILPRPAAQVTSPDPGSFALFPLLFCDELLRFSTRTRMVGVDLLLVLKLPYSKNYLSFLDMKWFDFTIFSRCMWWFRELSRKPCCGS